MPLAGSGRLIDRNSLLQWLSEKASVPRLSKCLEKFLAPFIVEKYYNVTKILGYTAPICSNKALIASRIKLAFKITVKFV